MRIFCFLSACVLGMVSFGGAADQPLPVSSSKNSAAFSDADRLDNSFGIIRTEVATLPDNRPPDRGHRYLKTEDERNALCFTMRSYLMARESEDSDVTEMVGYSTCQRSSRYGVKKARESGAGPSR